MDDSPKPKGRGVAGTARFTNQGRTIDGCGCFVAPVAAVVFLGGWWGLGEWLVFRAKAEKAEAKVVELVLRPHYKATASASYDVTFEFRTAGGVQATGQVEGIGRMTGPVKIGETATILYDRRNPSRVRLDTIFGTWGPPAGFVAAGGLALLSVWAEFSRGFRRREPKKRRPDPRLPKE